MKYAIDETELARLEALACAAGDADYSAHDDADDSTKYAAAACNDVPALVAEVRRLREKVEAWEWFEECYEVMRLLAQIGPNRADAHEEAVISAFDALKRAVHADRE